MILWREDRSASTRAMPSSASPSPVRSGEEEQASSRDHGEITYHDEPSSIGEGDLEPTVFPEIRLHGRVEPLIVPNVLMRRGSRRSARGSVRGTYRPQERAIRSLQGEFVVQVFDQGQPGGSQEEITGDSFSIELIGGASRLHQRRLHRGRQRPGGVVEAADMEAGSPGQRDGGFFRFPTGQRGDLWHQGVVQSPGTCHAEESAGRSGDRPAALLRSSTWLRRMPACRSLRSSVADIAQDLPLSPSRRLG